MTKAWDELWSREIPEAELDRLVNTDWLRDVKTEGDALQEKVNELEDWEKLAREQADTLLRQHAKIKKLENAVHEALAAAKEASSR